MFAVIYRGFVKPNLEEQYLAFWKQIAAYFVLKQGAIGSTLHRAEDGMWIAYSKWPDKSVRDASWLGLDLPEEIQQAIIGLRNCLDVQLPEICMEVIEQIE